MNLRWFGDSYDIVKRFLVDLARQSGYTVYIDPMFTCSSTPSDRAAFLSFIGAATETTTPSVGPTALLIDPDTGIGPRTSATHVSTASIAERARRHELVLVYDQAFSRAVPIAAELQRKLAELQLLNVRGFYYDSHARFLFCSRSDDALASFHRTLIATGLPRHRLVPIDAPAA